MSATKKKLEPQKCNTLKKVRVLKKKMDVFLWISCHKKRKKIRTRSVAICILHGHKSNTYYSG